MVDVIRAVVLSGPLGAMASGLTAAPQMLEANKFIAEKLFFSEKANDKNNNNNDNDKKALMELSIYNRSRSQREALQGNYSASGTVMNLVPTYGVGEGLGFRVEKLALLELNRNVSACSRRKFIIYFV